MKCECGKELTKIPEHLKDLADWCCYRCATRQSTLTIRKEGGLIYEENSESVIEP